MQAASDPTQRFGARVDDYRRWRPGYPPALVPWLVDRCGLRAGDAVADIGSGTGLFTRELLAAGLQVFAVEPNAPMRAAAEIELAAQGGFVSVDGTAEHTGLAAGSVKLITAAQAFHWFDVPAAREEFRRVLAAGGRVALIWNLRRADTAFLAAYERLLREHAPAYERSGRPAQADEATLATFFGSGFERRDFEHEQRFDREGLRGRLQSSSYTPARGAPGHEAMIAALDGLFDAHQRDGRVSFAYTTRVFLGAV